MLILSLSLAIFRSERYETFNVQQIIDFGDSANFRRFNDFDGFSFFTKDANFGEISFGDFSFGGIPLRCNLVAPYSTKQT